MEDPNHDYTTNHQADLERELQQLLEEEPIHAWLTSGAPSISESVADSDLSLEQHELIEQVNADDVYDFLESSLSSISCRSPGSCTDSLSKQAIVNVVDGEGAMCSCKECGVGFRRKHDLLKHVKTIHSVDREFGCPICSQMFKRKHHMENHCRQVHDKAERVACNHCDKVFSTDSSRRRHIRVVHGSTQYD